MANSLSGLVGLTVGLPCSQVGTLLASVALVRIPNSYPGGFRRWCAGTVSRSRLLRAQRSGGGAHLSVGVFQPARASPLATRPSPGRVRPVWNSAVSRSGEPSASRHETGLGEPPERDEQLAGERHDHHPADPSTDRDVEPVSAQDGDWRAQGQKMARESFGRNALRCGQRVSAVDRSGLSKPGEAKKGLDPGGPTIRGDDLPVPGAPCRRWRPSVNAVEWLPNYSSLRRGNRGHPGARFVGLSHTRSWRRHGR